MSAPASRPAFSWRPSSVAKTVINIPKFDNKHSNAELRKKEGEWFWVRIPTAMDSLSRQRMMQTSDGREAYCVYVHLVSLAAKDIPRGVLADERGPFSLSDIALKTSIPQEVVRKAIDTLKSVDVGWIVVREWNGNEIPSEAVHSNSYSYSNSSSEKKKETHKRFAEFWELYPRKAGKAEAKRRWGRMGCDGFADDVLAGLARCKASKDWKGREAKYLPYPATWLNAEGWYDEPDSGDANASSRAKAAAFDALGEQVHAELFAELKATDTTVHHSRGNMDTERALRKLARDKGLLQ